MRQLAAAIFAMLMPIVALAHPHIWVYTSIEMITENDKITALRVNWNFDELYSTSFLQEADENKNKKLEPEEAAKTIQAVFIDGQEDLYPFMYIRHNGQKIDFTLENPTIWMEDETLRYQFDIKLKTPQPIKGTHALGIYDPEFYVAFEQDWTMKLPENVTCEQELAENKKISIYFDSVNPETYALACQ